MKAQHIFIGGEEEQKSSYDKGLIIMKRTLSFSYPLIWKSSVLWRRQSAAVFSPNVWMFGALINAKNQLLWGRVFADIMIPQRSTGWEVGGKARLPSPNLHATHAAFTAQPTVQLQRPASRVACIGIQFMNH